MLRDRGSIKWTSLMLPEHVELLKQMWKENEKVPKPIIDIQMMEVFQRELIEAYENKHEITLHYYDSGSINKITGKITAFNLQINAVTFTDDHTVLFSQIVSIP